MFIYMVGTYPLYFNYPQIEGCRITRIDSHVLNLKHIVVLDLPGNKITQLSDTIPETLGLLSLANNGLDEISLPFACAVGHSSRLHTLILSDNRLKSVPSMIFNCKTLTRFHVGRYVKWIDHIV